MALSFEDMFFPPFEMPQKVRQVDVHTATLEEFVCMTNADDRRLVSLLRIVKPILAPGKACISGGFLRRAITGDLPGGDIDVYFLAGEHDHEDYYDKVDQHLRRHNYAISRESPAVHEYVSMQPPRTDALPVQLIHFAAFRDPINVIDCNDFTNSMIAYDGETVYFTSMALDDIQHRHLEPHRMIDLPRAFIRMEKFVREGWKIEKGAMKEMARQIRDHDRWEANRSSDEAFF